ncbi:MAG: MBL fold metallo-hydrolase [Elusimicrobia bacterium]|nr:MBL fold metallo-hydrolase [Elusimicrobiota bacterium]
MIRTISLDFVNAFLVEVEGGYVLIDTGIPAHWEKLDKALAAAGCVPGKLKLVVITHGDWDHTGNGAKLREKYGAPIAMHPDDAFMAERLVFLERTVRSFSRRIQFAILRLMMRLRKNAVEFRGFKPEVLLRDGQSLAEYGFAAKVIHIPGHTKGSIAVLTDSGDLFAGDTFVNRKTPVPAEIILDAAELEKSLARLRGMSVKTIYPGHGTPFEASLVL